MARVNSTYILPPRATDCSLTHYWSHTHPTLTFLYRSTWDSYFIFDLILTNAVYTPGLIIKLHRFLDICCILLCIVGNTFPIWYVNTPKYSIYLIMLAALFEPNLGLHRKYDVYLYTLATSFTFCDLNK